MVCVRVERIGTVRDLRPAVSRRGRGTLANFERRGNEAALGPKRPGGLLCRPDRGAHGGADRAWDNVHAWHTDKAVRGPLLRWGCRQRRPHVRRLARRPTLLDDESRYDDADQYHRCAELGSRVEALGPDAV